MSRKKPQQGLIGGSAGAARRNAQPGSRMAAIAPACPSYSPYLPYMSHSHPAKKSHLSCTWLQLVALNPTWLHFRPPRGGHVCLRIFAPHPKSNYFWPLAAAAGNSASRIPGSGCSVFGSQ